MENYVDMDVDNNSIRQELSLESSASQPYPQESSCEDRFFRVGGFSGEGGFVSRILGYMHSTELMVFSARVLFNNLRINEYLASLQGVGPLKAWNNFWKSMSGNVHFPPNLVFNEALKC
ncbi:hypothetical protein CDL12_11720 [Handroanthus impetiginosus]|uniref:Uncharacterized protein n=1 Tax=Handroanthus impetiginosus TaxID=429701 RepID=A0A2G9HDN5_9LAMI|nr:hypothetical protein CDL12_11720 [Handroanthus impetiginosus]